MIMYALANVAGSHVIIRVYVDTDRAEMRDEPVWTGPGRGPSARTASRCSEVRAHTLIFGQPGLRAPTIPHLPYCPHLLISPSFCF